MSSSTISFAPAWCSAESWSYGTAYTKPGVLALFSFCWPSWNSFLGVMIVLTCIYSVDIDIIFEARGAAACCSSSAASSSGCSTREEGIWSSSAGLGGFGAAYRSTWWLLTFFIETWAKPWLGCAAASAYDSVRLTRFSWAGSWAGTSCWGTIISSGIPVLSRRRFAGTAVLAMSEFMTSDGLRFELFGRTS